MITVKKGVVKEQINFWNQCLFHPTDAVEDSWGKRILDRISADGAIKTVRIYAMLEDIVYTDENDNICYDFRLSDLRLDYLHEKGFNLLIAYGGMPDCMASFSAKTSNSKNKTRYKGKMWNTATPKDYSLWEEICYEYTKHNIERYGLDVVSRWRFTCFNEPDVPGFFLSEIDGTPENAVKYRLPEYCKMYKAFEKGLRRASEDVKIGGPAMATCNHIGFLEGFLDFVKENELKLDFISIHNYGTTPDEINDGSRLIRVANQIENQKIYTDAIIKHGFYGTPICVDEWGFSIAGYFNREECPALIAREHEMFSAYFAKLIHDFIYSDFKIEMLCICLSGQHEMVEDFSGFRNFFTLNFICKPIYNAYILSSKLHKNLVETEIQNENIFVVPTKNENGDYSVLVTYSDEYFEEDLPEITEKLVFEDYVENKKVTLYCIDKETTNPYRLYEKMGMPEIDENKIKLLREEGKIKPIAEFDATNEITLKLTANCMYLVEVK